MLWRSKKTPGQSTQSPTAEQASSAPPSESFTDLTPQNSDPLTKKPASLTLAREALGLSERAGRPFVVPASYTVSGSVITSRPVVIQGEFSEGELTTPLAVVLSKGQVTAPMRVNALRVHGTVASRVTAREMVEVASDGRLEGEVETPAMSVEPGGSLCGALLRVGATAKS